MFSSVVQLGQVRLRGRRGECSGAISYHYVPVDISLSLSDSHLWFPLAIFHGCTKRGFITGPTLKKGPKCPHRPLTNKKAKMCPTMSLLCHPHRLSWCLQICNHSLFLPPPLLSHSLCMCCKYTIPYVEVSGMRGWWRAGPVIFPPALKAAMTHVQESCSLPEGFFFPFSATRCLQNYLTGEGKLVSRHQLLLLTHNHPSQV